MGKIFFAMLAGFAEMEREMMIERTNDGLAQAAAEGRHGGRRPVISKDMCASRRRCADGESVTSIAKGLTYKTSARACPVDHWTGSRSQIRIDARSTVPW